MYTFETLENPTRIEVSEGGEWVATFTPGCYTVTLAGPERTFAETFRRGGATLASRSPTRPGCGRRPVPLDQRGRRALAGPRAGREPGGHAGRSGHRDAVRQGRARHERRRPGIAGDASYGPLDAEGEAGGRVRLQRLPRAPLALSDRAPGSPRGAPEALPRLLGLHEDGLGIPTPPPGAGYPDTVPLSIRPRRGRPCRVGRFEMYGGGPGWSSSPTPDPGDRLSASWPSGTSCSSTGRRRRHAARSRRHVPGRGSRRGAPVHLQPQDPDGPTLGDAGGASVLDGSGHYATAFRAVRRL